VSLGYVLLYRAAENDEARDQLEEMMTLELETLNERSSERRREAILAFGGIIGGAA